ncbi:MAG: hypothetical protein O7B25_09850 [Gammaproteobacteria bacterium]|nr:hypothetical protein [Gammaproteobacteria bacterium]
MSPADPLEQLLSGAFNRELNALENAALVARVMQQVRRKLRLRAITLTVAAALAIFVMVMSFSDLTWPVAWVQAIEMGNLPMPIGLLLTVFFVPWLLVLLDDRV